MRGCSPDVTNVAVFDYTEMSPVTCLLSGLDALRTLGSVVDATMRPDETRGQTPVAVLVLRSGSSLTPPELVWFCRERLAGSTTPRETVVLEAWPRNASGKVVRPEPRAAHGG